MLAPKYKHIAWMVLLCATFLSASCTNKAIKEDSEAIDAKLAGHTTFTPGSWVCQVHNAESDNARNIDWISSFRDPLLADFVGQALANNRDLMAASANVERANALAVQAGAQSKPQANLAFASTRSGAGGSVSRGVGDQALSAQLSWEVDLWGRISAGQRVAVASAEAAAADYKYAQHSLAAATAKAYFVAIDAGQQAMILKEILDSLNETLGVVNVQYENGLASGQDLALTKSDLASTREQLITLEASQREALRALEVLLGRYPGGDIDIAAALPSLPAVPPTGVPSDVLERRPDLIASERRVAAAFNAIAQSKAARLPQLNLTSNIGGASSSLSSLTDPANVAWQVAGNLLAPIFDGGVRKAQVQVSTAEQKQALSSYAQAALNAFNEVETNLDLATTLVEREKALTLALSEAEKALGIARLRYQEGEIALIDLLTMQQRVLSEKSSQAALRRIALEQRVSLYLALGGDWIE